MSIVLTAPVIPTPEPTAWQGFASANMNNFNASGYVVTMDDGRQLLNCQDSNTTSSDQFTRLFDPVALTYSGELAGSREFNNPGANMSQLSNGKVLQCGSTFSSGLRASQVYDRGLNTWSNTIGEPTTSQRHGVALANGGNEVYRFGGRRTSNANTMNEVWIYTTSTNTWASGPSMPKSLEWPIAVPLEDGTILIGAGETSANGANNLDWWFLNPSTGVYTPTTAMPSSWHRKGICGAVQLDDGTVYIAGGRSGASTGTIRSESFTFNPKTEVWAAASVNIPLARDYSRMNLTKLPDGRLVLHYDNTSYVSTHI